MTTQIPILVNGSRWLCKFPQCWEFTVQYLEPGKWVLLTTTTPAIAHLIEGEQSVVVSLEKIEQFLRRMKATRN